MRPEDYIVVTRAETEILTSPAFAEIASPELVSKIRLEPTRPGGDYQRLALPRVGRRVVQALRTYAAGQVPDEDAVVAEGLANAVEQRLAQPHAD